MKKLIILFSLLLIAAVGFSQKSYTFTVDTVTNTDSGYLTSGALTGNYTVSVIVYATNISGTTAGTGYIQGSTDGTNYATIYDQSTWTVTASSVMRWTFTNSPFLYYRVYVASTGTHSTKLNGAIAWKPKYSKSSGQASFTAGTLTNAGTSYLTTGIINGNYNFATHVKAVQTTGTTAGTAWLQASNDNTNFYTINAANDTMAVTNGAIKVWPLTSTPDLYYRVKFTGTGTQSTALTGKWIIKPTEIE